MIVWQSVINNRQDARDAKKILNINKTDIPGGSKKVMHNILAKVTHDALAPVGATFSRDKITSGYSRLNVAPTRIFFNAAIKTISRIKP